MQAIGHKLDRDQFGGQKGNSISHYLIEMTNFILYNQDLKNPQATLAAILDYKQGFNRCQHSKFIEVLSEQYDCPGWLLRILVGYLRQRKLRVRFKQQVGEEKNIPGGAGQGVPIGLWIFLVLIDSSGPKAAIEPIGSIITQPLNSRRRIDKTKKKWIDDFTVLAAIDLKKTLVPNMHPIRPVPFRGRTEHSLPIRENMLQSEIDKIVLLCRDRNMLLSNIKTKAMIFNPLRIYDITPEISISPGTYTEVVEEQKILGTIIRSDMRTISNTEYICKRAYTRMWILRRLKALGCPVPELLDVLRQQILSICEGNVAYWGPMITKEESNMLERCLKTALHIIYQERYINFRQVLRLANMKSLKIRRVELITTFSKKAFRHSKFRGWFSESEARNIGAITREKPIPRLRPIPCRTQRYERSSLPLMTKLLCWHPPLKYTALDLA